MRSTLPREASPHQSPSRSFDPLELKGPERRAWEARVKATPGLKATRRLVVNALLDDSCWGKCWSCVSWEWIAEKTGLSRATVYRVMPELVGLGVLWWIKQGYRRWIVFPSHPHAGAFLRKRGIDPPVDVLVASDPQNRFSQSETTGSQPETRFSQFETRFSQSETEPIPQPVAAQALDGGFSSRTVIVNTEIEPVGAEGALSGSNENEVIPFAEAVPDPEASAAEREASKNAWAAFRNRRASMKATPKEDAPTKIAPITPDERDAIVASVLGPQPAVEDDPRSDAAAPDTADVEALAESIDREAATIKALSKIGPGATRTDVMMATVMLTALFRDGKSKAFYRKCCNEVIRGELPTSILGTAVRAATGPDVRNPGAAFAACVNKCRKVAYGRHEAARKAVAS